MLNKCVEYLMCLFIQYVIQYLGPVAVLELERHRFLREPNSGLPSPTHIVAGPQKLGVCFCGDSGSHLPSARTSSRAQTAELQPISTD